MGQYTVLYAISAEDETKLGVSVSKSIGSAVVRNKIKRKYREIFRLNRQNIVSNTYLILKAKNKITAVSYHEIEQDIFVLLKKAYVYKEPEVRR